MKCSLDVVFVSQFDGYLHIGFYTVFIFSSFQPTLPSSSRFSLQNFTFSVTIQKTKRSKKTAADY